MKRLKDRTGAVTRVLGVGGVLLLVASAATLREPPPEPPTPPKPPPATGTLLAPPASAEPMSKRFLGLIPVYPRAKTIPMGRLEANGNPTEMAYFETTDAPGAVMEFYAREFHRQGHRTATEPDGAGGGAISYYDAKRGALIAVTTVGVGGTPQRTQVFPSIIDTPEGMHLKAEAPTVLPRAPGATTMMHIEDRNPGPTLGNTTVTEVAQGTPASLASFYRRQFQQRGYVEQDSRTEPQGVELLDFQKPGERISLSLSPMTHSEAPETLVTGVIEYVDAAQERGP
ncbi:hypothetical protein MYSTI_00803 [Myxococcus stipitatus DSM 14675]|uniref:Uncharacterized protein n=1 Tax=Myxococcus stipitatus (strain DSM 14675 / JCM 12634 / Mx s8) TaxID=1278073 RepID=L7U3J6_MYXSD|nr:hypothetical protein [Myxococcus stipitatus]AGC42152.1 hypothetical protein MYSTI_00803 [Myxococcus stipitatus DSM 14675]